MSGPLAQAVLTGVAIGAVAVAALLGTALAYALAVGQKTVDDIFEQEWTPW